MEYQNKKCSYCQNTIVVPNENSKVEYFNRKGRPVETCTAQQYHDLWHKYIEYCDNCGYANDDISTITEQAKSVLNNGEKLHLDEVEIYNILSEFKSNSLKPMISAAYFADVNNNKKDCAIYNLMAGDEVYHQLMFWKDEHLDDDGKLEKGEEETVAEIEKFGDSFYSNAFDSLKKYIKQNPYDYDYQILLAGEMFFGDAEQKEQAKEIISKLEISPLTDKQKQMLKYICD